MRKLLQMLKPAFILFAISGVMALILGCTNFLTAETVKARAAATQQQAIAKVLPAEAYEQQQVVLAQQTYDYTIAKTGGRIVGYAFTVSNNGYGGAVETVIGLDSSGKITGVEVSDVSGETPGLGQNAAADSFKNQFVGKSSALTVVKSGANSQQINSVTGATVTSKAVTENVNTAFKLFQLVKEGAPDV